MEEESRLLPKLRRVFSGEAVDTEDVANEILSIVNAAHQQGVFAGSELEMIRNILEYGEKDAKDIMTHRKSIIALDGSETVEETLETILEQNYSRFPVYMDDIDNIIGVLHLRDVVRCYLNQETRHLAVCNMKDYIWPVSFIPETKSIDKLFKQMQAEKNHIAIVLDEYGQTAGLVAMEDIIEEIVGNILDEYDEEEEYIVAQSDHTYLVNGMTELDDLEAELGIVFEEGDYETLNGFLFYHLGRIPSEEEQCTMDYQNFTFRVLSVGNNTIQTVKITKNKVSDEITV